MKVFFVAAAVMLSPFLLAQGGIQGPSGGFGGQAGGMGGAGFGRAQAQTRGAMQQDVERNADAINNMISQFLNGEEARAILTPGEFCEWKVDLKKGEVLLAEARSDVFDPALEIADESGKVLAQNDDRFLGDQRPLVLFRAPADGTYLIHVRCFQNKAGGPAFMRYVTFGCADINDEAALRKQFNGQDRFLVAVPMKAGDLRLLNVHQSPGAVNVGYTFGQELFENGLPNPKLAQGISSISGSPVVFAPATGTYYVFFSVFQQRLAPENHLTLSADELKPAPLALENEHGMARADTGKPGLWQVDVKAGQLLEVTTPELSAAAALELTEKPDISKYDLSKPELNPFYPLAPPKDPVIVPTTPLRARPGDGRRLVFVVNRNATLWIGTSGYGTGSGKEYTFRVEPGAKRFEADRTNAGTLRIGDHDYWAFDGKVGDVIALKANAKGFRPTFIAYDAKLGTLQDQTLMLDADATSWRSVVQTPGRYLVEVSAMGDGGSGPYELARTVLSPHEFGVGAPAQGKLGRDEIKVLTFKANPNRPLYLHYSGAPGAVQITVYNEKGEVRSLPLQFIDGREAYGILKVYAPETFVIVLAANNQSSDYHFEISDLPDYHPAGKK